MWVLQRECVLCYVEFCHRLALSCYATCMQQLVVTLSSYRIQFSSFAGYAWYKELNKQSIHLDCDRLVQQVGLQTEKYARLIQPCQQRSEKGREMDPQDRETNTRYTVLMLVLISNIKTLICSNERLCVFINLLSITLAFLIFALIISEKVLKNFPSQSYFNTRQKQGANLQLGYSPGMPYN